MTLALRVLALCWRLAAVGQPAPLDHVVAAIAAGTAALPAELLLAIAAHETGIASPRTKRVGTKRYCGPLQVGAGRDQRECDRLQALGYGYFRGRQVLEGWVAFAHGNVRRGLIGTGCSWQLDELGDQVQPLRIASSCRGFDTWVLDLAARLGWRP